MLCLATSRLAELNGLNAASICKSLVRLGDFSQVCLLEYGDSANKLNAFFLMVVDFCTIPFSFSVLTATEDFFHLNRYTEGKLDTVIPISKSKEEPTMGLWLNVTIDGKHKTLYEIALQFQDDKKKTHLLIRSQYESGIGAMCPLHDCSQTGDFSQACHPPWIDFHNETFVSDTFISYHPCDSSITAKVEFSLEKDEYLMLKRSFDLVAHNESLLEQITRNQTLMLGIYFRERNDGIDIENDGYLKLDGGTIHLYAERNQHEGIVQMTVSKIFTRISFVLVVCRNHDKCCLKKC